MVSLIATLITERTLQQSCETDLRLLTCVRYSYCTKKRVEQNILENRFIAGACIVKVTSYTVKCTTIPWQYNNLLLDFFLISPLYS